ncbi:MAG: universal stress protein [Desulfarculus sp.]|nr:universal stress protein [Desulfarculus sp.]
MWTIKQILWPVDFSPALERVLPYVMGLAQSHGARLHLLHVTMDLEQCAGLYDLGPLQSGFLEGAQAKMDALCQGPLAGVPGLTALVACGDPVEKILAYAQAQAIDLIVVGTHGHKGLKHAILGSVAENLLRRSPVPVLTVNPHRLGQQG